jgi:hypothetical protein
LAVSISGTKFELTLPAETPQEGQMKNAEVSSWDGATIQDVAISVGTVEDVKVDDGQDDVVDEEIDLECEDWFGSIEEESPAPPSRRPAA